MHFKLTLSYNMVELEVKIADVCTFPGKTKPSAFRAEGFMDYLPRCFLEKAAADCRGYRTIRLIGHIQGWACLLFV